MTARIGSVVAVLGCALVLAPAAVAAGGTVTAVGTAQEKVTPKDPKDNQSIKDAVDAAHKASIPAAIQEAKEEATALAGASGLTLGPIQSVDENVGNGLFSGYGFYTPFGPNQFCGTTTRRVKNKNGHRVTKKVHRCFVPPFVATTVAVTFATA
jgi:uncharacterized protein DUF541